MYTGAYKIWREALSGSDMNAQLLRYLPVRHSKQILKYDVHWYIQNMERSTLWIRYECTVAEIFPECLVAEIFPECSVAIS